MADRHLFWTFMTRRRATQGDVAGIPFGEHVASVANSVLVSNPGDDVAAINAGAVYMFDTSGQLPMNV